MAKPLVSVIIPAYNEQEVIERLLKSLKEQTYNNIEIIVVDDGSFDKTVELSKKYTTKVFPRKHAERSVQRNFAATKANGKYLLVLDADMELAPQVIHECVEQMEKGKMIGAVTIPEESVARTFWEKVKAFERNLYNLEGDIDIDAARFFPKRLFDKVGGYDENITGPEDWDLPERIIKMGYKRGRIKANIYHYERVPNPFSVAKKKFYYGLRSHRYLRKHKVSTFSAKTIYFLRPVFYRNWKYLIRNPLMTLSMFFMLSLEQIGGGLGYFIGKYRNL